MKRLSEWKLRADEIRQLKRLVHSGCNCLELLGYTVDLDSGDVCDRLKKDRLCSERDVEILHVLLAHYAAAEPVERTGKLMKFRDLPGGYAYEKAFIQRVIQPVATIFGDKPEALVEAAQTHVHKYDTAISRAYHGIAERRGRRAGVVAAARKLLLCCYSVLKNKRAYHDQT